MTYFDYLDGYDVVKHFLPHWKKPEAQAPPGMNDQHVQQGVQDAMSGRACMTPEEWEQQEQQEQQEQPKEKSNEQ